MSVVQSLIFERPQWTIAGAKAWIKMNPQFKVKKIDVPEDGRTLRFRQEDPKKFKRFRIKPFGRGIKAVIGFKK